MIFYKMHFVILFSPTRPRDITFGNYLILSVYTVSPSPPDELWTFIHAYNFSLSIHFLDRNISCVFVMVKYCSYFDRYEIL